jgi:DNA-binding transcriptional MerR regulator
MKKQFTTGQLASFFNINIQTLYYYDKIGLFSPRERARSSSIRHYSFDQIYELSTILYLKRIGLSLDEIKDSLSNLTPQTAKVRLLEKSEELKRNWEEIHRIDDAIHRKLEYVEKEKLIKDHDSKKVIYREKRRYLSMGDENVLFGTDSFYFYPTIAIYSPVGKTFGALLDENEELKVKVDDSSILTIEKGYYLVDYHIGRYETIQEHRMKIKEERPDLKFTGTMYNFNIYDQFNSSSPDDYLTKMEFQLDVNTFL